MLALRVSIVIFTSDTVWIISHAVSGAKKWKEKQYPMGTMETELRKMFSVRQNLAI
jgi:hypothetical protein